MSTTHILFDFGGVVIDQHVPQAIPAMFTTLAEHFDVGYDEVRGLWMKKINPDYMAGLMSYDEVVSSYENAFEKAMPENHYDIIMGGLGNAILLQEVFDFIPRIKAQGYTIGLLSDMSKERRDIFVGRGWYAPFDILFNSCDMGASKAKDNAENTTRMYDIALETLGVSASDCVFIDDREDNCLQANKVGIDTIQAVSPEQIITDLTKYLAT